MTKVRRNWVIALVGLLAAAALAYLGATQARLLRRTEVAPSQVPVTWGSVHESPGHKAHVGKGKIVCRDCHDESDGGFRSLGEASCASCHAKEVARTHAGNEAKPTTCLTCHAFGAKEVPTCLGCHKEAQGKRAAVAVHVSSKAPCTSCHSPHRERTPVQANCARCHKDVTATHGRMQVGTDIAAVAAVATVADAGGPAATHHANGTCTDCHAPHARAAEARGTCQGCHEGAPRGARPSGHPACVTCHVPHELTLGAVKACAGCHDDRRTALTTNHPACKSCHAPHATEAAAGACTTCHGAKPTLGAPKVAAHAACGSCHKPHDSNSSPGAMCVTCHKAMAVEHAPGRADKCTDCHAAHPGKGGTLALPASGSAKGAPGRAPFVVACTSCHKQGTSDGAAHAKGLQCTTCHKPHAFALGAAKGAFCATCHASEAKVALASSGHKDCLKCHSDVHKPTRGAACATCHAAEASSAPRGHQACQSCHEAHDGRQKPSATCPSCHAQEAASKHAHVQGGCASCHRPHGPSGPKGPAGVMVAPACTTCHESAKLPGLHKLVGAVTPAHDKCATCHSSHQPPRADRATCTSCHQDRKNHQPAATQCNGCHIFRSP